MINECCVLSRPLTIITSSSLQLTSIVITSSHTLYSSKRFIRRMITHSWFNVRPARCLNALNDRCLLVYMYLFNTCILITLNRRWLHSINERLTLFIASTPQHSAGRYWGGSAHSSDPNAQSAAGVAGRRVTTNGADGGVPGMGPKCSSMTISKDQVWSL